MIGTHHNSRIKEYHNKGRPRIWSTKFIEVFQKSKQLVIILLIEFFVDSL